MNNLICPYCSKLPESSFSSDRNKICNNCCSLHNLTHFSFYFDKELNILAHAIYLTYNDRKYQIITSFVMNSTNIYYLKHKFDTQYTHLSLIKGCHYTPDNAHEKLKTYLIFL